MQRSRLQNIAVAEGMETLVDDGIDKVRKGIATLEELVRIAPTAFG